METNSERPDDSGDFEIVGSDHESAILRIAKSVTIIVPVDDVLHPDEDEDEER